MAKLLNWLVISTILTLCHSQCFDLTESQILLELREHHKSKSQLVLVTESCSDISSQMSIFKTMSADHRAFTTVMNFKQLVIYLNQITFPRVKTFIVLKLSLYSSSFGSVSIVNIV